MRALFKLVDWERKLDFACSKKDCEIPILQNNSCVKVFFGERLDCQSESARDLQEVAFMEIC
jgi:hypothetical protein